MCNGICVCKKQREEIENRIRELLAMLNNDITQQDFFSIKSEILALIDEIE